MWILTSFSITKWAMETKISNFEIRKHLRSYVLYQQGSRKHEVQIFQDYVAESYLVNLYSGLSEAGTMSKPYDGAKIKDIYKCLCLYFHPVGSLSFLADKLGPINHLRSSLSKNVSCWTSTCLTSKGILFFLIRPFTVWKRKMTLGKRLVHLIVQTNVILCYSNQKINICSPNNWIK